MAKLPVELVHAVRRARGEDNLKVSELEAKTGLSRYVLYRVINGTTTNVRPSTIEKLNKWLYQRI